MVVVGWLSEEHIIGRAKHAPHLGCSIEICVIPYSGYFLGGKKFVVFVVE